MALVKLALENVQIDYVVLPSRMNIDQVFAKYKPDYLINGCMYDMTGGKTITNSVDENARHGVYFSKKGIGIINRNKLVETTIDDALKDSSIIDFIAGAPLLVSNGQVKIDSTGLNSSYMSAVRPRSVFGMDGKNIYLYVPDKSKGFTTLANECKQLGMTCAVNLDGGGSTLMGQNVGGKLKYLGLYTEKRKNTNWILIYNKKGSDAVSTAKQEKVTVRVEEKGTVKEFEGVVIDGVTMAPVRKVFESQGAAVSYDASKKLVTVKK